MIFLDTEHDYDSSTDVWDQNYDIVYKKRFSSIFDFQNRSDVETSKKCKRWYIKIDANQQPELRKEFPKFKMAGDCIFNFNDEKIRQFKKMLLDEDMILLMRCRDMHHEHENFAFMPISGGLNDTKGILRCYDGAEFDAVPFDRPDVAIVEIDNYFNDRPTRIFSRTNKGALKWYLSLFNNDTYQYCKDVYLIDDKDFVDEFIASGKQPLNSRDRVVNYMHLAIRFWELRREMLCKLGVIK